MTDAAMDMTRFDLSDPDAISFCPSCGAGYTARVVQCTDCNEELVPRSRVEVEVKAIVMRLQSAHWRPGRSAFCSMA